MRRDLLPLALLTLAADAAATTDAGRPPTGDADAGSPTVVTTCGAWKRADVPVRGSMTAALVAAVGEDGSQVAAHFARIFMWDLDLRRDVVPGDQMTVLWRRTEADEIEIGSAHYTSQRLGRVLRAYRFRGPDDQYSSYWDAEGVEVARRLKASPLRDYQQITALLKDRPTHQGMDFKTPVGTPVYAPRAGMVSRVDWRLKGNGRCLELRFEDGVTAKFLHLSAVKVGRQSAVRAGQIVALTGNTGRSTAPHLHYQLNRGRRTLDPVNYHGSSRRRLGGAALDDFKGEIVALERGCGAGAAKGR